MTKSTSDLSDFLAVAEDETPFALVNSVFKRSVKALNTVHSVRSEFIANDEQYRMKDKLIDELLLSAAHDLEEIMVLCHPSFSPKNSTFQLVPKRDKQD